MYKFFKNRYKTSHLSTEDNAGAMKKYYDGENVEQLDKEYNIDISVLVYHQLSNFSKLTYDKIYK